MALDSVLLNTRREPDTGRLVVASRFLCLRKAGQVNQIARQKQQLLLQIVGHIEYCAMARGWQINGFEFPNLYLIALWGEARVYVSRRI